MFTQLAGPSGIAVYVIGSVITAVALAPVYIVATDLIVASSPPARAGAASAISETGTECGGALGIAILGSIGTATYRSVMAGSALDGLPEDAAEAARRTLGGAAAIAAASARSAERAVAGRRPRGLRCRAAGGRRDQCGGLARPRGAGREPGGEAG